VNTSRRFAETNPPVACSQATPVATARKSRAVVVLVDIHFSLLSTHRFSHPNCSGKFMYVGMDPKSCLFPARPMQDGFMRLEPARARLCSHTDGAGSHRTETIAPRRIVNYKLSRRLSSSRLSRSVIWNPQFPLLL
jgi:hypothetical protein